MLKLIPINGPVSNPSDWNPFLADVTTSGAGRYSRIVSDVSTEESITAFPLADFNSTAADATPFDLDPNIGSHIMQRGSPVVVGAGCSMI